MAEERLQRRLAAILAADVAGYSRLMSADEEGTLAALTAHRTELIDPKITEFGGRIANTAGDSILAEFPSVVEALRCAIDVQRAIAERNAGIPEDHRIEFRVGLNLGDVIEQNGDLLGEGVNVAARLEGLADPGGICLSRAARDQVRDRMEIALEDLGEIEVKNIARPVRVFRYSPDGDAPQRPWRRVRNRRAARAAAAVALLVVAGVGSWQAGWFGDWGATSVGRAAQFRPSLPGGPSIAVMAFTNLSGDPAQNYFSDGLTEDVIAALGRFSNLTVLSTLR